MLFAFNFRTSILRAIAAGVAVAGVLTPQPPKLQPGQLPPKAPPPSLQSQSSSSITSTKTGDGEIVEIRNVSYEVTGTAVPGRPGDERLLLRKTTHTKETLGDIGSDSSITLEAWRFGDDPRQKPLYSLRISGSDGHTLDNALFVASRGLEEVDWLSIYKLGTSEHLFDTYVPLVSFSISKEIGTTRYVGLEVPPDDTKDARLKQPNVVAVLSYASEDRVLREALITCDDPNQAAQLRSYADESRSVAMVEGPIAPGAKSPEPSRTLRLVFSDNYPSPPNTKELSIPLQGDDLDLAHAQLPAKVHIAAWKR
jgi:hypothetical protein